MAELPVAATGTLIRIPLDRLGRREPRLLLGLDRYRPVDALGRSPRRSPRVSPSIHARSSSRGLYVRRFSINGACNQASRQLVVEGRPPAPRLTVFFRVILAIPHSSSAPVEIAVSSRRS